MNRLGYRVCAHTDHIQGLTDVAKNFKIHSAIIARNPSNAEDFKDFQKILDKKDIPLTMVSRGDVLNFGDIKIEFLYPLPEDDSAKSSWDNNSSIVFRLSFGDVKILMTGDIEKEAERNLINTPEYLQAAIVKVAHHGSKTSSTQEFIDAVKPKVAVIPVGRESPFGHPKPEIVERWKNSGARVLTTGEKGTITFLTDGKNVSIQTFAK